MKRLLGVLVALALLGPLALGAGKTWTSSNGRFTTQAELIDYKDGKAQLKKSDGSLIDVPLVSLCAEDRDFVKRQFPGAVEEQFRPGADYREWKSKDGKFTTLAEFFGYADGKVQLRKLDGTEISVERSKLSITDGRWITDELKHLREQEEESAAAAKTSDKDSAGEREPAGEIGPQEVAMKLVRLDPPKGRSRSRSTVPAEYILRLTTPQQFYMNLGGRGSEDRGGEFQRIVKREPTYSVPIPLRGVAKFGSHNYAFALDAAGRQPAGYNKLYFDANGNGDLTDDKPISATDVSPAGPGIVQSQFPRVDLTLDMDGTPVEYAFLMSALCRKSASESYVSASLYAAAVREGTINQGKKPTRLLLVDHNSNGRFDDVVANHHGTFSEGDLLLVNPNSRDRLSADATMGRDRHLVNKTVCIENRFYSMEIQPAGEKLKLTPAAVDLGYVANSSPAYRIVLFNDKFGVVMVGGMKDQKIPLPEGKWSMASYTIDAAAATGGSRTAVTASFGQTAATATVSQGSTAKLQFGAPFRPVVTAERSAGNKVQLSLAIAGAGGERCTNFYINGTHPPQPRFVIKDKSGTIVHQGVFEWG